MIVLPITPILHAPISLYPQPWQRGVNGYAQADINLLLSDSLHTPIDQCLPLAQLVHVKTGGNAFFTRQLLHALEGEGLLSFDRESACWRWETAELKQLTISDNIVDLLLKDRRLPG